VNSYLLCKVRILTHRARGFGALPLPQSAAETVQQIIATANDLAQFCESPVIEQQIREIEKLSQQQNTTALADEMMEHGLKLFELHRNAIATELVSKLRNLHRLLQTLVSNRDISTATNRSFSDVSSMFAYLQEPSQPARHSAELAITDEADNMLLELEKLTDHYLYF